MKFASSFGKYEEEWYEGDWYGKGEVPVMIILESRQSPIEGGVKW
jgi:hypothetical protein